MKFLYLFACFIGSLIHVKLLGVDVTPLMYDADSFDSSR